MPDPGWYLGNNGNPPFVAFDNITDKQLPVRKLLDAATGEAVHFVVYDGGLHLCHADPKLCENLDWQPLVKIYGSPGAHSIRKLTTAGAAEIKNITTHVSGPDKVEPKKAVR